MLGDEGTLLLQQEDGLQGLGCAVGNDPATLQRAEGEAALQGAGPASTLAVGPPSESRGRATSAPRTTQCGRPPTHRRRRTPWGAALDPQHRPHTIGVPTQRGGCVCTCCRLAAALWHRRASSAPTQQQEAAHAPQSPHVCVSPVREARVHWRRPPWACRSRKAQGGARSPLKRQAQPSRAQDSGEPAGRAPCSSGGSTSGGQGSCRGPGQHPGAQAESRGGPVSPRCRAHARPPAIRAKAACDASPRRGPAPPPAALEARPGAPRGRQAGAPSTGGEAPPPPGTGHYGLTCEMRRNSCAFCREDKKSGLWCAPAWKTARAERPGARARG